jgi:tetratricopeptide (TPR) repeat protein
MSDSSASGPTELEPPAIENLYVKAAAERLRSDPRDLDALEVVGAYFFAHGHIEKALECFHRVSKEDPKYPGIWRLKAKAFEALGDLKNADVCRQRGSDPHS